MQDPSLFCPVREMYPGKAAHLYTEGTWKEQHAKAGMFSFLT